VATFLVETYEPREQVGALAVLEARARAAAGTGGVSYVRSIFTPQDELCLHVFDSPSRERLEEAMAAARFGYVRMTEAAEVPERRTL
jgi:hypothetical protein